MKLDVFVAFWERGKITYTVASFENFLGWSLFIVLKDSVENGFCFEKFAYDVMKLGQCY